MGCVRTKFYFILSNQKRHFFGVFLSKKQYGNLKFPYSTNTSVSYLPNSAQKLKVHYTLNLHENHYGFAHLLQNGSTHLKENEILHISVKANSEQAKIGSEIFGLEGISKKS